MKRMNLSISFIEASDKARKLGFLGGFLGLDNREEEILLNRYQETNPLQRIDINSVTRDYIREAAMAKACEYIAYEEHGIEGPYFITADYYECIMVLSGYIGNGTRRV